VTAKLRVGVLGSGPIARAAHFGSATRARNAELYAICDVAADLLERMARTHCPRNTFQDYDAMLADPDLDAVIVATADAFHIPAAVAALKAGKHVLCEKPLGISVEQVEVLKPVVVQSGRVFYVGHMKRFDAGLQNARAFISGYSPRRVESGSWSDMAPSPRRVGRGAVVAQSEIAIPC